VAAAQTKKRAAVDNQVAGWPEFGGEAMGALLLSGFGLKTSGKVIYSYSLGLAAYFFL
jgi:hypothetical protein